MRITYISWAEHCSRSDHTARELGGTSHMVYWGSLGSRPSTIWLKYVGQAARTWRILARDRPDAVFVMTPPVMAPLAVWLYCLLHRRCRLVMDAHTAAFLHPRWRHFQALQHWLARRAAVTIVHNDHLKALIEAHGGRAVVVGDVPVRFPDQPSALAAGFHVAVVCSFNPDEPIANMLEAARQLPDVSFHVTGKPVPGDPRLAAGLPPNLRLTGFLSDEAYGALIAHADAVMTLTTRDHTMLRGAWEAIYQGTPVIVSDWPILRESFDQGAIHVDNSVDAIVAAVRRLQADAGRYRAEAAALRQRKERRWQATREALLTQVARA